MGSTKTKRGETILKKTSEIYNRELQGDELSTCFCLFTVLPGYHVYIYIYIYIYI